MYGTNIVKVNYFNNGGTSIFVESSKKDNSYKIGISKNNASYEINKTDFNNLKYRNLLNINKKVLRDIFL